MRKRILKATNIYEGTKRIAKQTIRGNYSRLSDLEEFVLDAYTWGDLRYLEPRWFKPSGVSEGEEIGPSTYLEHNEHWLPSVFTALVYNGWHRTSIFFDTAQPEPWTNAFASDICILGGLLVNQSRIPRRVVNAWATLEQIQVCVNAGWIVSKEYHSDEYWYPDQAIEYCHAIETGRFMVIVNVPAPLNPAVWGPMVKPIADACRERGQYLCVRESGTGKEVPADEVRRVL